MATKPVLQTPIMTGGAATKIRERLKKSTPSSTEATRDLDTADRIYRLLSEQQKQTPTV